MILVSLLAIRLPTLFPFKNSVLGPEPTASFIEAKEQVLSQRLCFDSLSTNHCVTIKRKVRLKMFYFHTQAKYTYNVYASPKKYNKGSCEQSWKVDIP